MKRYIKASIESELQKYEDSGKFNYNQMKEIRKGLENGVDVSVYADPEYDYYQMGQIRKGLEKGLDVSWYADLKYNLYQMWEILWGLEQGVDVSWYADPKYNSDQMGEIRLGLNRGVDVSVYADPKYDGNQMEEIREKLERETSQKPQKPKRVNWKSIARQLEKEAEDGIDPLYELTDAGEYVDDICREVETALGVELEPSIQAGWGGIWFYSKETGQTVASNYDYQTFNEEVVDLAINSKNKTEFKKAYKNYLENILDDPEYAPEYDD